VPKWVRLGSPEGVPALIQATICMIGPPTHQRCRDDKIVVLANAGPLPLRGTKSARVLLDDGSGKFRDGTTHVLPPTVSGVWFDVEAADFDGDARVDLFFASRGGPDRLVVRHGD
jgi:hypothetical protein